jgi:hypothetical protein
MRKVAERCFMSPVDIIHAAAATFRLSDLMVIQCLPPLDGEPPHIFSSTNIQMMLCANEKVVVG